MATIECTDSHLQRPALRLEIAMPGVVWAFLSWRRRRQTMVRLVRLSDHLIRDVGLEPEVVRAVAGTWDVVLPAWPGDR